MPIEALSNAIDIIHICNKNIIYTQNTVHTTHTATTHTGHGHSQNLVLSQDAVDIIVKFRVPVVFNDGGL
jgi:hypothetical protein